MSGRTWVYSDPHFYHENICRFFRADGEKLRPWENAIEMTEDLINSYNELVDDGDRVYILGDVAFKPAHMRGAVSQLKGRKVLVKGNHDPDNKLAMYAELFDDVRSLVVKHGFVLSHVPLHPQSLTRWGLNIHGHLHDNVITNEDGSPDLRYYNACVEKTGFKPKLLDDILKERASIVQS